MKLTDRMKEYYLQEKFFEQHGTYYYDPNRPATNSLADDLEYEQELTKGCGFILLSWLIIVVLFIYITCKFF